jgi:RND superfamily putative drug exporter
MSSGVKATQRKHATGGLIARIAAWSSTHPWIALTTWALVVATTFAISSFVDTRKATETEILTGESQRAAQLVESAGFHEPATEFVLLTVKDGQSWEAAAEQTVLTSTKDVLSTTPYVQDVSDPVRSADGTAMVFRVSISGDSDTASERIGPLREAIATLEHDYPAVDIRQTGSASIAADFQEWLGRALNQAAVTSVPATLLILLIAFGAWMMSLLPVLVGAAAVLSALGLWAAASQLIPDQGLVPHVILLIGLAVGVDYALFYLRRFREERHLGHGPERATAIAARTAGHSIIVSGTAVALAMTGLLLMRETLFAGVAIGAILVVVVAMLSSLTAMPALMRLLGNWIDRPRVPIVWRLTNSGKEPRLLRRALRPVTRHPWLALGASMVLLALMALPAIGMRLTSTTIDDYPRSLTSLRSYDALLAAYPDNTSSARVVITVDPPAVERLSGAADAIGERVGHQPEMFGTPAEPWVSADGRTLVLDIPVLHKTTTAQAQEALRILRTRIVPAVAAQVSATDFAVGGPIADNLDATRDLAQKMPWVIFAVVATTFVFMVAVYRSVLVAVTTVMLNIASTLASFGLLTLIFQNTWAQRLLAFKTNGHLVSWVPLMLFVVLSGLSLDYHVLVVNRIRENTRLGMRAEAAVLEGITKTAPVVTSAAMVMLAVFAVFGTLSFIELKQIGVGLAIATFLDVTLVRLVALPAALVAGRRVLWWPHPRRPRQAGDTGQRLVMAEP